MCTSCFCFTKSESNFSSTFGSDSIHYWPILLSLGSHQDRSHWVELVPSMTTVLGDYGWSLV